MLKVSFVNGHISFRAHIFVLEYDSVFLLEFLDLLVIVKLIEFDAVSCDFQTVAQNLSFAGAESNDLPLWIVVNRVKDSVIEPVIE